MKLNMDAVMEACAEDVNKGFCIKCGAEHYNVEPDANAYRCEVCGSYSVCGAEEIVLMYTY